MHEREAEEPGPAPAPAAPERRGAPDAIRELHGRIGNRAVARLLAREAWETPVEAPKDAILLSFDRIEAVYVSYHRMKARSFALKVNDPKVMAAAGAATRTQVGSLNYDRWLKQRGGLFLTDVVIGPVEYKDAVQEAREQQDYENTFGATGQARQYRSLCDRAQKVNGEVVAAEYHAHKLKSPEGINKYLYEIGGAGFGFMYGIGARGVAFGRDKLNPLQQGAETAFGYDSKKDAYDNVVGKQVDDVKKMASEMRATAGTSVDLASGRLHALYLQTRPPYEEFQTALREFYGERGTSAYQRAGTSLEALQALGAMTGALDRMEVAALKYLTVCAALGIRGQSAALNALSKAIEGGMVNSVEVAVDILAGSIIGGGQSMKGKLKGIPVKPNVLADPIPGSKVIEPAIEIGKAGVKESVKPPDG